MQSASSYAALAEIRQKDLPMRLGFALFLAVGGAVFAGPLGAAIWIAAVLVGQGLDALLARAIIRRGGAGRSLARLYIASITLSAAVYSSISAYTWFEGGLAGKLFAILTPAGALLNAALQLERAPRGQIPVWGPHLAFLLGLPLVSGIHSPEPDLPQMAFVSLGGVVYVAHLVIAVRKFRQHNQDKRRDAAALREMQSTLSAFVATVPASVMVTDTQMRVLEASPSWLAAFGLTLEETRGRTVYDLAPDYFERFRPVYERCLAGEQIQGSRLPGPAGEGNPLYLRAELTPWRDGRGEVGGLISAALDITEMVEALERTERSQQRLQMALEIADLHVWECDYVHQTVETEGAASTFFDGEVDQEAFLRDSHITIDPRDRALIADEWTAAVLADRPFHPEYRIHRKDGKEVWATCAVRLIRDEKGQPVRLIGAMQNITERKRSEAAILQARDEAQAANRAKSAFLATMSHEIRTPLNGVIGMAQAMTNDQLTPAQQERIEVIRQSGETLLAILNDVLDLAKIEAGKLDLEITEFDLTRLVAGAHGAFTALAERKGLDFSLAVEPQARGRYRSDSTRIRQILYNLISNALKFTDEGEVAVRVAAAPEGLQIEVSDTGCGMSEEVLGRLFGRFEQADPSTTRRFGGTGLGLAISRELADLLGASLTAESAPEGGSRFVLTLPLVRLGPEDSRPVATTATPVTAPATLKVLAAEDNAVNQLVLKTLLHAVGVEPVVVSDGVQAVAAWRAEPWDVVLMDVQMPLLDGPAATRAIREEEARTGRPRTPIIALTANAMANQVEAYFEAGMDGYVSKPIDAAKLYEALSALPEPEATEA
jgi:PAS domain S-box-containing protein